jgi:ferredoxin
VRVAIDPSMCLGNARCMAAAPEVFDVDDDGVSSVLDEHPGADLFDRVRLAVRSCPTGAISITE